jgi:hypothetical protein
MPPTPPVTRAVLPLSCFPAVIPSPSCGAAILPFLFRAYSGAHHLHIR